MEAVDEVLDVAQRIATAIARRDVAALRPLLAARFVHRSHGGAASDAEMFLNAIAQIPGDIRFVRLEETAIDLCPGGALATGVGHVVKALAPEVEVICVQPLGAPALTRSWRQRRVVTTDSTNTIADGVAGRRPIPAVLDDLLLVADDAVLVQEASITAAMRMLLDHAGLVVEPSAALGIAAVLADPDRYAGRSVATVICGSNVAPADFRAWTA